MEALIRTIQHPELPEVFEVTRRVFGERPSVEKQEAEAAILPLDRVLVADEPGRGIVASVASYAYELTMPGSVGMAAAGITNVGVLPTHRRRGMLRTLVQSQLADVAERGEAVAILTASEAGIYGRFGYGLASRHVVASVRPDRARFAVELPARTVWMERAAEQRPRLASLYEAARFTRPGTVSRTEAWWQMLLGSVRMWKGGGHFEVAVVEPDGDDPGGYALYEMVPAKDGDWFTLSIRELVAATPATHLALWRFLLEVDLVSSVNAELPPDDLLAWSLSDFRAVRTRELRDGLFLRVLDTPAALSSRRYGQDIDIVIEVYDEFRPGGSAGGRFRLQGGPDGASCQPTSTLADVSMGVAELGSLLLGGVRPTWLAALGRIEGPREWVMALDRAMYWSPEPFCATRF